MPFPVRNYIHPEDSFATISEWKAISKEFIELEKHGIDTRGGIIDDDHHLVKLINRWFKYQLYVETQRYKLLTQRNVLDFIEDFVNHRVWQLENEFKEYFIDKDGNSFLEYVRIGYFYSRGDLEPFALMDSNFTKSIYGTTKHEITTLHWTTKEGLDNIKDSIENGGIFALSTFTKQYKEYFRPESNILVKLKGNLVAAFKSDAKTIVTDSGNKAVNMYRLGHPEGESNLCNDKELCNDSDKSTYLWNEIVMKPSEILGYKKVFKYR